MLTIYIQKVLDTAEGCGMETIYMIQKVLDTAGRESPV